MKKVTVKHLWIGVFLLLSAQNMPAKEASDGNLVKNSGFEITDPGKAISHGSSGFVADWTPLYYPAQGFKAGLSNDAATGKNSVYLENHLGKKSLTWLSDFIPVSQGEKLLVGFAIKTEKLQAGKDWYKPGVMIIFYDKDKKRIAHRDVKRFGAEISEWTRFKEDFTVPAKNKIAFMRMGLVISYCKGKVLFDDVSIKRKPKKEVKAAVGKASQASIFPIPKVIEKRKGLIKVSGLTADWSKLPQTVGISGMKQLLTDFLKKKDIRQEYLLS